MLRNIGADRPRVAHLAGTWRGLVLLGAWLTVAALAGRLPAASTLDVGTHGLLPDTADQVIVLAAVPGDPIDLVTGFNLRAQIGDGLGDDSEPIFSGIDFLTDTIWSGRDVTTLGGPVESAPQFAQASVVLNQSGESVAADGVVARLLIDTTGFSEGTFPLLLEGTQIGQPSVFIGSGGKDIPALIVNGTIEIGADRCGDFDRDGDVDAADLTQLLSGWTGFLPPGQGSARFEQGDCDGDGDVDAADLTGTLANWTGFVNSQAFAATAETLNDDSATGEVWWSDGGAPASSLTVSALSSLLSGPAADPPEAALVLGAFDPSLVELGALEPIAAVPLADLVTPLASGAVSPSLLVVPEPAGLVAWGLVLVLSWPALRRRGGAGGGMTLKESCAEKKGAGSRDADAY